MSPNCEGLSLEEIVSQREDFQDFQKFLKISTDFLVFGLRQIVFSLKSIHSSASSQQCIILIKNNQIENQDARIEARIYE